MDGFHAGARRSTYSAANFASVGPEAEDPGPRAVGLDAQHEALQGGIVHGVFALAGPGRERQRIAQVARNAGANARTVGTAVGGLRFLDGGAAVSSHPTHR